MKYGYLALAAMIALATAACEQKSTQPTVHAEQPAPSTAETEPLPPMESDPYASDPMIPPPGAKATSAKPATGEETLAPAHGGQRTHVVQKGDTLYSIARKYYGSDKRWKEIWNANKRIVPDPNKLPLGAKLVIP